MISYKITELNPLRTDESVCGTGDLCGSVFLDERFEQYMLRLLGDQVIDKMKVRLLVLSHQTPLTMHFAAPIESRNDAHLGREGEAQVWE